MRVAVIGAGAWGKNLVATFDALGALGGICEASPALRAELTARYPNAAVWEELTTALESDVTAVAIATPAATHFAVAWEALLAGKDVFVEKPMTLTSAEAEALIQLAEARGRVLMVGHLLLYQPAVVWIENVLASGELGRLHGLHQERLNLGRARSVENALWSLGVHDLAVLFHLTGARPTSWQVSGQRVLQPDVEDDVYLHLSFPQGVEAHLHTSWLWPERRRRLTVVGSAGMLVYDELEQVVYHHRKGILPDLSNRDEGTAVGFSAAAEPLKLELSHFLECVMHRSRPRSDGQSGLEVVRVLEKVSQQLEERHEQILFA